VSVRAPNAEANVDAVEGCSLRALNLLSNAIKFTLEGGHIWLKAGRTSSGGQ
jgi:hypothetical protein